MKIDLFEIGEKISFFPTIYTEKNKSKLIRFLSVVFTITIYFPVFLLGMIIIMLSVFQLLWEEI